MKIDGLIKILLKAKLRMCLTGIRIARDNRSHNNLIFYIREYEYARSQLVQEYMGRINEYDSQFIEITKNLESLTI